uniref:Uncharacterized protein n=1 Tax=Panagrolaimus sp. ES5 TaxID=591445 RepID=A0AC34F7Z4_9BILA
MFSRDRFFVLSIIFGPILVGGNAEIKYLNNDNPSLITCLDDIEDNSNITVCVEQKDGLSQTLELLLTHMYPSNGPLDLFSLYDSADMSNFTGTLDSDILESNYSYIPRSIYSHSKCFTIFHKKYDGPGFYEVTDARAMFRIVEAYQGACNFWPKNVFDASSNGSFVAASDPIGQCETIILAGCSSIPLLSFSNMSPTTCGGNAICNFVVKNAVNGAEYFHSNFSDATNNGAWYNVSIYAPAISIVTTSMDVMGTVSNGQSPAIITFSNKLEIRGIVSSLKYSGIEDKYYTSTFLYQFVTPKAKTTFTMKHHDGDDVIIYDFNSNNYT